MENLLELEPSALAERLLGIARAARSAIQENDPLALHDLLQTVRNAADGAQGERADLLQVAEAFLRALARSDLGRTEVSLRRFVVQHPEEAEPLLVALASGTSVSESEARRRAGESFADLVEVGALRVLSDGRVDLRPALRGLARDLIEPPALRMWRRVRDARSTAAQPAFKKPEDRCAFLSGQLGITRDQAERHLRAAPLEEGMPIVPNYSASDRRESGRSRLHTRWKGPHHVGSPDAPALDGPEALSDNLALGEFPDVAEDLGPVQPGRIAGLPN